MDGTLQCLLLCEEFTNFFLSQAFRADLYKESNVGLQFGVAIICERSWRIDSHIGPMISSMTSFLNLNTEPDLTLEISVDSGRREFALLLQSPTHSLSNNSRQKRYIRKMTIQVHVVKAATTGVLQIDITDKTYWNILRHQPVGHSRLIKAQNSGTADSVSRLS